MDQQNHRRVPISTHNGRFMIPREDELRLLYLTDVESRTYGLPPLSPYLPFGVVRLDQCALEVRLHANCGHKLSYRSWRWITTARRATRDSGLLSSRTVDIGSQPAETKFMLITRLAQSIRQIGSLILHLSPIIYLGFRDFITRHMENEYRRNEDLSLQATRKIFCWTLLAEGTKEEDREIWKHDWLQSLQEGISIVSSSASSGGDSLCHQNDSIMIWRKDIEMILGVSLQLSFT
ncbi:hypothetical protein ASPCADRAFT_204481 [Aspergillus carbonarius ITEM 5010]|uniref:Uncharacterized protein n=1 Tax=Aspergillus carbonarius (strain ITEM 5010) TaxID=602072 RepID=A0A1R3RWB2_ASPC5|nr:hypothetical protein ASPCADRAFT_204481 [Aspergillus carbonarius ITEM 5010]